MPKAPAKVKDYLVSINRLYEDLEYEQALEQIQRARRFSVTEQEASALSLYEGVIFADMSRKDAATAAFRKALSLNPTAVLPVKVSPKVEQLFEALRPKVPPAPPVPQSPPALAAQPSQSEQKPVSPESARTAPVDASADATSGEIAPPSHLRPRVLVPAIAGGVLMMAGGTTWVQSRRELSRLRSNDPELATRQKVRSTASRGRTYQTVGAGLLGAGLVSLTVATGLYFLPGSQREVSLELSTDGTSAFVSGRWP